MALTTNWITKADLILHFGEVDLPIDDNGDVSDIRIDEAIQTGITQIEAYMRPSGIIIPFSADIKAELKSYLLDIVKYHYSNSIRTLTEMTMNRYQEAISYLNKISSGKIALSESSTNTSNKLTFAQLIRG